jgi:hypothetical protein
MVSEIQVQAAFNPFAQVFNPNIPNDFPEWIKYHPAQAEAQSIVESVAALLQGERNNFMVFLHSDAARDAGLIGLRDAYRAWRALNIIN